MELQVLTFSDKKSTTSITISDDILGVEFKEPLVHQVINAYLAAGRAGSKAQKTRAQVRGGGIKPWRQKGTGRARAGSIRSPLWRSGGVIFAATPRDYTQKVNKKMYRKAMVSILAELVRQQRLVVVDKFEIEQPKTKVFLDQLKNLDVKVREKILVLTEDESPNLLLASRNIHYVKVTSSAQVDPVSLIAADKTVITVAALKKLEERLA